MATKDSESHHLSSENETNQHIIFDVKPPRAKSPSQLSVPSPARRVGPDITDTTSSDISRPSSPSSFPSTGSKEDDLKEVMDNDKPITKGISEIESDNHSASSIGTIIRPSSGVSDGQTNWPIKSPNIQLTQPDSEKPNVPSIIVSIQSLYCFIESQRTLDSS